MEKLFNNYVDKLTKTLSVVEVDIVHNLAEALQDAGRAGWSIYICGNGGSAGNAIHLANDFIYGAGLKNKSGLRAEALSVNAAVLTCLGNDLRYDSIFSEQIRIKGNPSDVLIVLSGSGNSANVVKAIETANQLRMKTFTIVGFTGGRCKELAQYPIHFEVEDIQIADDL